MHLRAKPLGPQPVQRPCTHSGTPSQNQHPSGQGAQGPLLTTNTRWAGRSGTPLLSEPTSSGQHLGTPSQRTNTQWAGLLGDPFSESTPSGQAHSGTPSLRTKTWWAGPLRDPLLRTNTWWATPGDPLLRPNTRWAVQLRDPFSESTPRWVGPLGCQQGWCQPQPPTCRHLGGTHGQARGHSHFAFPAEPSSPETPCSSHCPPLHGPGLHYPRAAWASLWPLVPPPDQTSKQAPRGRSFQPEGPLPARRPPSSPVCPGSWTHGRVPHHVPPACRQGQEVAMSPGSMPAGPQEAQQACPELTQPFCPPPSFTRPPRRLSAIPGALRTWLRAQHTQRPAGGHNKPCPQGQPWTCSTLRGRQGGYRHQAASSKFQEKKAAGPVLSGPCLAPGAVSPTETPSRPGG